MFGFGDSSGFGVVGIFLAVELVYGTDDNKDNEGNDEKINDVLDEIAIGDMGGGIGAEDVWYVDSEGREVETAGEEAGNGHDDVVDERFDDSSEGATDGDTDGKVDDAAAVDELFKLVDEGAFGDFFDRVGMGFFGFIHIDIIAWRKSLVTRDKTSRRGWSNS